MHTLFLALYGKVGNSRELFVNFIMAIAVNCLLFGLLHVILGPSGVLDLASMVPSIFLYILANIFWGEDLGDGTLPWVVGGVATIFYTLNKVVPQYPNPVLLLFFLLIISLVGIVVTTIDGKSPFLNSKTKTLSMMILESGLLWVGFSLLEKI